MTGYDLADDVFVNIGKADNHEISLEDMTKVISFFGFNEEASHICKIGFVCNCARERIKKTMELALVYGDCSMLNELVQYVGKHISGKDGE